MIEPKSIYMLSFIWLNAEAFPYKPIGGVSKNKEDEKMKEGKKKILLAVLVISLVLLSGLAVLSSSASAQSATPKLRAISGSLTVNPVTYTSGASNVIAYVSGGNFDQGATIDFYLSSSDSSNGIIGGAIGSYTLSAHSTTLNNPVVFNIPSVSPGDYYILAEEQGAPGYVSTTSPVHIVSATPSVAMSPSSVNVGWHVYVMGSGFDPDAALKFYVGYPGSSLVLGTASTDDYGTFFTEITIPAMSYGQYTLIAQETNGYSSSYPLGTITAQTTFQVTPNIQVSPISTDGSEGSTFTITGSGFPAGWVIEGYSSTSTGTSAITIAGVNTYFDSVTIASDGSFTVTVTLADDVTTSGELPVSITVTNPSTSSTQSWTFHYKIWLSIPGYNPTLLVQTYGYWSTYGYPGQTMVITLSGFPASSVVNVYFDSQIIKITTDSNGFARYYTDVPSLPAGVYTVVASSQGLTASNTYKITTKAFIDDSAGYGLDEEYAASGSVVTITVVGMHAYEEASISDGSTDLGTLYANGVQVNIIKGGFDPYTDEFVATSNGVLMLNYTIKYSPSTTNTGTSSTIQVNVDSGYHKTAEYYMVGYARINGIGSSYQPGATVSISVSNLLTPDVYPDLTPETLSYLGPFSIYIDNQQITLTSPQGTTFYPSSGSANIVFKIPTSMNTGLHILSVVSYGGAALDSEELIVSSPTLNSGVIMIDPYYSLISVGGQGTSNSPFMVYPDDWLVFDLYNFPTNSHITMTYYTQDGAHTYTFTPDANGAKQFEYDIPANIGNIPYKISFSATVGNYPVTITGDTYYYEIVPVVAWNSASNFWLYGPVTDYYTWNGMPANAGSTVGFYAYGLTPNTVYDVYLSDSTSISSASAVGYFTSDSDGKAQPSVNLPSYIDSGTYYLDIMPASSSSTTASLYLTIDIVQPMPLYAFPGQIVNIGPIGVNPPTGTQYYKVTISLNDTAYKTIDVYPQHNTLSFSFQMPNGNPGNWWMVSYNAVPVVVNTIKQSIPANAVATSITPHIYDIATTYPQTTYSKSGEATFTLPDGYSVDPSTVSIVIELAPGAGMAQSAAVAVNNIHITNVAQNGNELYVDYVVTFTLTGFTTNPAVVVVNSVTASFTGTGSVDAVSLANPQLGPLPSSYHTGDMENPNPTVTVHYALPDGVTATSFDVSALNILASADSGTVTSHLEGDNIPSTPISGEFNAQYTVQLTISDWTSAPVTVSFNDFELPYEGTYTPTSVAVAPNTVDSNGSANQWVHLSLSATIPTDLTVTDVHSIDLDLVGSSTIHASTSDGSITIIGQPEQQGTALAILINVTFSDSNTETLNVENVDLVLDVSGTLHAASITPSDDVIHPIYTTAPTETATVNMPAGYTITNVLNAHASYSAPYESVSYASFSVTGNQITFQATYNIEDFIAGSIINKPLPTFNIEYQATSIAGTADPDSYTLKFTGTFTEQGTATFNVPNGVEAIDSFALSLGTPDQNAYVNETGLVINHWYVDGTTLTVEYTVTFTVYNTLTVNVDSAKVSYDYIQTTTTQSIDSQHAISGEMPYPITLVQGNGAYIMGISDKQIAEIVAAVNGTITASLKVPLEQLNASVEAINNAVAEINTSFGKMYATLDAINATVTGIYDGMVTLSTDIGQVKTAISNLNATIVGMNNGLLEIYTAVGYINTTLNNLNAKVDDISNGIMTIQTDVGTLKVAMDNLNATVAGMANGLVEIQTSLGKVEATLDSLNATLVSINGNIATIQTDVGNMQTSLSDLDAKITSIQNGIATIQTMAGNVSAQLTALDAKITDIQNGIATIQTDIGNVQTSLSNLNAKVDSISGDIATIKTDVGTVKTSLQSIDAKISSLQGDMATIKTDVGTLKVSLNDLNATIVSTSNNIKGGIVDIQTTLGDIKGTVTDVKDGVATIQTDLGTVKTDVSSIKTNTDNTASSVNTTLYWEIGVLVLVIITLALVAVVIVRVNKISKGTVKEEKVVEEEETKEE